MNISDTKFSAKVKNTCLNNNLKTIDDLVKYYNEHYSFIRLNGCGEKTNKVLIEYLQPNAYPEKLSDKPSKTNKNTESIHISNLGISKRSLNLCYVNNIYTLKDLQLYYEMRHTFRYLPNCGEKSNFELINVINNNLNIPQKTRKNHSVIKWNDELLAKLSDDDIGKLNYFADYSTVNLPVRARRIYTLLVNKNKSLSLIQLETEFKKLILKKHFGVATIKDFEKYIERIKNLTEIFSLSYNKEKDSSLHLIAVFRIIFNVPENILMAYFKSELKLGEFELFRFINFLFDKGYFIKLKEYQISNHYKNFFSGHQHSIVEIAEEFSLTRERIRQILVRNEKTIVDKISLLSIIASFIKPYMKLNHLFSKSYFIIDKTIMKEVNDKQKTQFSKKFVCEVFKNLTKNDFNALVIDGNTSEFIFINSKIFEKYDFQSLTSYLIKQKKHDVKFNHTLSFESVFNNYFIQKDPVEIEEIKIICEKIIELIGLNISSSDKIVIKSNKQPLVYEKIYEILKQNNSPMHLDEIYVKMKKKYNYPYENDAIRGVIISKPHIFISLSRTSTYALKEWESERSGLKGGTIRDIVEDYLSKFDRPLYIREIEEYVYNYRKTNHVSIIGNLTVDKKNRFCFYGASFVGLKNAAYSKKKFKFKKIGANTFRSIQKILEIKKSLNYHELFEILSSKYKINEVQFKYFILDRIKEKRLVKRGEKIYLGEKVKYKKL